MARGFIKGGKFRPTGNKGGKSKQEKINELKQKRDKIQNEVDMFTLMPMPDHAFIEGTTNQSMLNDFRSEINVLNFDIGQLEDQIVEEGISPQTRRDAEAIMKDLETLDVIDNTQENELCISNRFDEEFTPENRERRLIDLFERSNTQLNENNIEGAKFLRDLFDVQKAKLPLHEQRELEEKLRNLNG